MHEINTAKISLSTTIGIIGAFIADMLGGWDGNIIALVVLMCIDFIMGLLIAIFWGKSAKSTNGGLSSAACWRGIIKKVCTLFVVVAAVQADKLIGMDFVRNTVIIGFCVSEIISILENAAVMGILPETVKKAFDKVIDLLKSDKDK